MSSSTYQRRQSLFGGQSARDRDMREEKEMREELVSDPNKNIHLQTLKNSSVAA